MINYFLYKGEFRSCEDSFTSTVFDLLKYLPDEIFVRILKNSLFHQNLPESGKILEMSYWAKWKAEYTNNKNFVEPDLFIRFEAFDMVIEVKRGNEKQQNLWQIENEIKAYFNEFEGDKKDLYFIQLGGLHNLNKESDLEIKNKTIKLYKTNWSKLLDQIIFERKQLDNLDYSFTNSYKRILDDLIKGFELHNFFKNEWLCDLEFTDITQQKLDHMFSYAKR